MVNQQFQSAVENGHAQERMKKKTHKISFPL